MTFCSHPQDNKNFHRKKLPLQADIKQMREYASNYYYISAAWTMLLHLSNFRFTFCSLPFRVKNMKELCIFRDRKYCILYQNISLFNSISRFSCFSATANRMYITMLQGDAKRTQKKIKYETFMFRLRAKQMYIVSLQINTSEVRYY